jgi:hypothetical protein
VVGLHVVLPLEIIVCMEIKIQRDQSDVGGE